MQDALDAQRGEHGGSTVSRVRGWWRAARAGHALTDLASSFGRREEMRPRYEELLQDDEEGVAMRRRRRA